MVLVELGLAWATVCESASIVPAQHSRLILAPLCAPLLCGGQVLAPCVHCLFKFSDLVGYFQSPDEETSS